MDQASDYQFTENSTEKMLNATKDTVRKTLREETLGQTT